MPITINEVYPWGRTFDEYRRMFSLGDNDLKQRILGCADGPAGFNAEMNRQGRHVISCDPLYRFSAEEIRRRVTGTRQHMLAQVQREYDRFIWTTIASPEALADLRLGAMQQFLEDYDAGRRAGRYVIAALPSLPFDDGAFDLALCSHLLFLYSDELSAAFHIDSILEMLRLAREARIFPLLDRAGRRSRHLEPVLDALERHGFRASVEPVEYEFLRGANQMIRVIAPSR